MTLYNATEMADILRDTFLKRLERGEQIDAFAADLALRAVGINATWNPKARCFTLKE